MSPLTRLLASELALCPRLPLHLLSVWFSEAPTSWHHVWWLWALSPEGFPKLLSFFQPYPPPLRSVPLTQPHRPPPCSWACLMPPHLCSGRNKLLYLIQCSRSRPDNQLVREVYLDQTKVMPPFLSLERISLYHSHSNSLGRVSVFISVAFFHSYG